MGIAENLLSLMQDYWPLFLVGFVIVLSIFAQLKNGEPTIEFKYNSSLVNPKSIGHSFDRTMVSSKETKIEFTNADTAFEPVMQALRKGDKINAIKLLREAKKLNLTDAKLFIDTLDSMKDQIRS